MKNILKLSFGRFFLFSSVIFIIAFMFAGKITVEDRGNELFTGQKYERVILHSMSEKLFAGFTESKEASDKYGLGRITELNRHMNFTPFGVFTESIKKIKNQSHTSS